MLPHRPDTSETLQFHSIRSFTEALASYTHAQFEEERVKQLSVKNQTSATTESSHIQDMGCAVIPPIGLSIPLVAECDQLAEMLTTAFLNPGEPRLSVAMSTSPSRSILKVCLTWDCTRFQLRSKQSAPTDEFCKKYPPISTPATTYQRPLVVQDVHGQILLWYLPNVLSKSRQVR